MKNVFSCLHLICEWMCCRHCYCLIKRRPKNLCCTKWSSCFVIFANGLQLVFCCKTTDIVVYFLPNRTAFLADLSRFIQCFYLSNQCAIFVHSSYGTSDTFHSPSIMREQIDAAPERFIFWLGVSFPVDYLKKLCSYLGAWNDLEFHLEFLEQVGWVSNSLPNGLLFHKVHTYSKGLDADVPIANGNTC